jgi:4-hydroxy-tetrahydrodipicolinate synthase
MRMTGSWVAVVTPYDRDGSVDFETFSELIDFHAEHGTSGLLVMGSTGESALLSTDERREIIERVSELADGKIPVFVGCTGASTEATLELARHADAQAGTDGVLLVVPPYIRPPQDALYDFFATVADSVDLPVAIYNNPTRVGVNIDPETMVRLAEIDNVVADKEAVPDVSQLTQIKEGAGDDIDVLCCDYPGYSIVMPTLAVGGTGTANVAGNVIPEEMEALSQPWETFDDVQRARELHEELTPIMEAMYSTVNPVPAKAGMDILGFDVGPPRKPLPEMADEERTALRELLDEHGFLDKYGQ